VIYATRAVYVAMGGFFIACIPDIHYFHIESQRLASQGMIGIYIHIESANLDHGNLDWALPGLQANNLPRHQPLRLFKMLGRDSRPGMMLLAPCR